MILCFFDTETTGLPDNFKISAEEYPDGWPHLVQLSASLYDSTTQNTINEINTIIKPQGFKIPDKMVHGISHAQALEEGKPLTMVLELFKEYALKADIMIAHNYEFDYNVMTAAYIRSAQENPLKGKECLCTMKSTVEIVGIPQGRYWKWPTLQELHYFLFKENFEGAHNAHMDMKALIRCYLKLKSKYNINNKIYKGY